MYRFRPNCIHSVHICGLLLWMSHVAWSVCLSVGHIDVLCKKTAEPIEIRFGRLTHVGKRNHVLDTSIYPAEGRPPHTSGASVVFKTVPHRRLRATPPGQHVIGSCEACCRARKAIVQSSIRGLC